jgi:glutathione peroxidase
MRALRRAFPRLLCVASVACTAALALVGCGQSSQAPVERASTPAAPSPPAPAGALLDLRVESLEGEPVSLSSYRGKALLVVNTASECGYTPQYAGLEALYERYRDRGLVVLGFPSNDFGGQEPGSHEQIRAFCQKNYGVTFPLFAKVHAKGPEKAPVFAALTESTAPGIAGEIKWNFTKFLVDPAGKPVARFESKTEPLSPELTAAVEKVLPR